MAWANDSLAKYPTITLHFTPTSGSWLSLVEVFFTISLEQAIRSWHLHQRPCAALGPPTREFVLLAQPGQFAGALLLAGV